MRQSLMAALAAWAAFAVAWPLTGGGLAPALAGLAALALSALWLTHVGAFAAREVSAARQDDAAVPAERGEAVGRRRALGLMLRAAGAGAVASIPVVLWSSESHAFCGQCTKNADCGVGYVCRNTAPVNSGKVCNECVKG
jgi:hypothetical protein